MAYAVNHSTRSNARGWLRRGLIPALALLSVLALPPVAFYGWFEYHARVTAKRHGLDAGLANALKHADAASRLYSLLRLMRLDTHASERIVVRLGVLNESVETYVKRGFKDTTLEMMRDLHNNMVGISLGKWRDSGTFADHRSRTIQLVSLARAGVLLRSEDDIRLSGQDTQQAKQSADVDWAVSWFDENRASIEGRTMRSLQDTRS